jgi:hypothetical protein
VTGEHDRAFDLKYAGMQRSDPVVAAGRFPVCLLKAIVFGMLGLPEALPMLRAGVVKPGDE